MTEKDILRLIRSVDHNDAAVGCRILKDLLQTNQWTGRTKKLYNEIYKYQHKIIKIPLGATGGYWHNWDKKRYKHIHFDARGGRLSFRSKLELILQHFETLEVI